MEKRLCVFEMFGLGFFSLLLTWMNVACATLSPSGVNYEVVALIAIKDALKDPRNVMDNWDVSSVDPCSWRMVICTIDRSVSVLFFLARFILCIIINHISWYFHGTQDLAINKATNMHDKIKDSTYSGKMRRRSQSKQDWLQLHEENAKYLVQVKKTATKINSKTMLCKL